jgi:hypothetical protein
MVVQKEMILPYAIEDRTVRKNANVDVGHNNVVEVPLFFVREKEIGHPDAAGFG